MCNRPIVAIVALVLALVGGTGQIAAGEAGPESQSVAPGSAAEADATERLSRGDYDAALPIVLDTIAYSAVRFGGASDETAGLISHFSNLYWKARAWSEAERFYNQALARLEPILGASDIGLAQILSYASAVESVMGRYDSGLRYYRKARDILLASAGPNDPRLGMIAFNLASALEGSKQWDGAETLYEAARDNWRRTLQPTDARLVEVGQSLDRITAQRAASVVEASVAPMPADPVLANSVPADRVYGIHLSSLSKSANADPSVEWERLQALYPKLLNGLEMRVSTADLGARGGVFYRIVAGPLTRLEAERKCQRLAKRHAWCRTVRAATPKAG